MVSRIIDGVPSKTRVGGAGIDQRWVFPGYRHGDHASRPVSEPDYAGSASMRGRAHQARPLARSSLKFRRSWWGAFLASASEPPPSGTSRRKRNRHQVSERRHRYWRGEAGSELRLPLLGALPALDEHN